MSHGWAGIIKPTFYIVMLTPVSVSFNDRNVYVVGETIASGPLKDQRIMRIDFKKRRLYTNKTAVLLGQTISYKKEKPKDETKQTSDSIVRNGTDGH